MNRELFLLALSFYMIAAAACTAARRDREPLFSGRLIAMLPMGNNSNDVKAGEKVRTMLMEEMAKRGYRLADAHQIDAALKELGVTNGGALGAVPFATLKDALKADVYCYGTVVEYGFKSAVALSQRKVEIALKCLDSRETKIFEDDKIGITTKAGLDAGADLAMDAAGKIFKSVKDSTKSLLPGEATKKAADATDVIADVDLAQETREAVRNLLVGFPR